MELLEKHFDIAFSAPDGIKKLRELILTLAMQGKLVPQNQNDQPASALLKEIEIEKKRLVKERKIRAQSPPPEIKPEEEPFNLPKGWAWVRLGEIGFWKSGTTPSRANSAYYGGAIPWVKSGEVKQGRISSTEETITEKALSECSLNINPVGAVLIAMYGANIGEVGILEIEATTNQAVCACTAYSLVDKTFLLNLLMSIKQNFIGQGAGAAQPNISREKIINTIVPLPPLAEQRRIVVRIDQLMARCDELEKLRAEREQKRITVHTAALNRLFTAAESNDFSAAWRFITQHFGELYSVKENVAELRKAILQLAVMGKLVSQDPHDQPAGELLMEIEREKKRLVASKTLPKFNPEELPFKLPFGWEWVRLGGLGETQTGTTPPKKDDENFGSHIPFIGPGDIKNYVIDYSGEGLSEIGLSRGRLIRKNSVLMVCIGGSIGKHAVNDQDISCNQQINTITPYKPDSVKYLFLAMGTEFFQKMVVAQASGSATPIINKQKWSSIPIPIPPASEQKRIVDKVEKLLDQCDKLEQHIVKRQNLADRLMNATVADATGVQMIGDVMATNAKNEKVGAGADSNKHSVIDQPEIELSTKNFTLRKFAMSTGYRSLVELDCLFHSDLRPATEVSPICLVGLNGSGKSNLIEAIADVFCFLELINLPWQKTATDSSKFKKNDHFFELEYDLETNDGFHEVVIKKNQKTGVEFYVRGENDALTAVPPGIEQLKLLPRRVIGYSSGLNETVSHPFLRTKTLYSEEVRDAAPKIGASMSESKCVIDTRTLYMDYESNAAILICNYIFRTKAELSAINDYTRVNGVSSFNLRFNKKRAGKSAESRIVRLTLELENALKSFLRCAEKESQYAPDREEYELEFNLDEKTAARFRKEFSNAEALFMAMHKWSLLNALVLSAAQRTVYLKEDVTKGTLERPPSVPPKDRIFNISDLKLNLSAPAITIDYSGLSDGEHQFIQVFGTVMLFNEPGSLFLFDEPESHFNPEWRTRFNVILNSLPNAKLHEFMISTHSPFLVSGSRGCNVFKFERKDANVGCKPVDFETYGASFDYLLNKLFGIESMIDQSARAELEEIIRGGNKEAMEIALGDFAESREKRRLYQALIEKEEGVK